MSARSILVLATCALPAFPAGTVRGQITPAAPSSCYATSLIVDQSTGQRLSLNLIEVDLATGAATDVGVTGVSTSARLPALAIDSGGNIYGGDQNGDIWRIDAATGAATILSSTGLFLSALAFDAADNLYGLTEIPGTFSAGIVSIDPTAGTWAAVVTTSELFAGLAFDPETGQAYVSPGGASFNPDAVFTVDLATGTETLVGNIGTGSAIPDIAFDDNADLFAVTGQGIFSGNYVLYSIDKATGAAAAVGTDLGFALVSAFDCFEQFDPTPEPLSVSVDIKPETCPNELNTRSQGMVHVAVHGTVDFDVSLVDPSTVRLNGVAPVMWHLDDVSQPAPGGEECACTEDGADGFVDLVLAFENQDLLGTLGPVNDGDSFVMDLTGQLLDATQIAGDDCVDIKVPGRNGGGNSAGKGDGMIPATFALGQNYPNPFNPATTISFALPEAASVHLAVYNVTGQETKVLVSSTLEAGVHTTTWDGTDQRGRRVSTGLYIYRMRAGDHVETRKMLLLE